MKKNISILLAILAVIFLFSGCADRKKVGQASASGGDSLNGIKGKGKFIVGLDDTFAPMGFRDGNGEIAGFDIDLAKEAAKRMGIEVEFKPVDWDGIVLSLKSKKIDVIWNGLTITDDRKEEIDFTKPYIVDRQTIVVNGNSPIKDKTDLAGRVVGLQQGSSSEEALRRDSDTMKSLKEVKKYSDNTEALMDLMNGRIDAVVVDEVFGSYYMQKKPGQYRTLSDNFGAETFGVGVRKEDKEFLAELDSVLDSMKADGTAKAISEKWFGKDIISE